MQTNLLVPSIHRLFPFVNKNSDVLKLLVPVLETDKLYVQRKKIKSTSEIILF